MFIWGSIFGSRRYNRPDPYLNSAIVLFDIKNYNFTENEVGIGEKYWNKKWWYCSIAQWENPYIDMLYKLLNAKVGIFSLSYAVMPSFQYFLSIPTFYRSPLYF